MVSKWPIASRSRRTGPCVYKWQGILVHAWRIQVASLAKSNSTFNFVNYFFSRKNSSSLFSSQSHIFFLHQQLNRKCLENGNYRPLYQRSYLVKSWATWILRVMSFFPNGRKRGKNPVESNVYHLWRKMGPGEPRHWSMVTCPRSMMFPRLKRRIVITEMFQNGIIVESCIVTMIVLQ